jgi:hypothetical protein
LTLKKSLVVPSCMEMKPSLNSVVTDPKEKNPETSVSGAVLSNTIRPLPTVPSGDGVVVSTEDVNFRVMVPAKS